MRNVFINLADADEQARQENSLYVSLTGDVELVEEFADRELHTNLFKLTCMDKARREGLPIEDVAYKYVKGEGVVAH